MNYQHEPDDTTDDTAQFLIFQEKGLMMRRTGFGTKH